MNSNKINDFLIERPLPHELNESYHIGDMSYCSSVQNVAYKLERKLNSDSLNEFLDSRPTNEELTKQFGKIAPSLAPTSVTLSRRMCSDTVKSLLENRPTINQLQDYGVYPKNSGGLHGKIREVEKNMTRSQVSHER